MRMKVVWGSKQATNQVVVVVVVGWSIASIAFAGPSFFLAPQAQFAQLKSATVQEDQRYLHKFTNFNW